MVTVVNRHQYKGKGIYIGRGTPLGNRFIPKDKTDVERDRVCDEYAIWLRNEFKKLDSAARIELLRLVELAKKQDVILICSCKPKRCHGDFVKHAIERLMEVQQ